MKILKCLVHWKILLEVCNILNNTTNVVVVSLEAEKKNLGLFCDIDSSVPDMILGDIYRLRQILVNMLRYFLVSFRNELRSNAVKFSDKGEIILKAVAKKVESDLFKITISVTDEGIGIPEKAQQQLFTPFYQADNS